MKKEMKKESPLRQRTLLKQHPAAHLNKNLIRYTYTNIMVQRIFYAIQVYSCTVLYSP